MLSTTDSHTDAAVAVSLKGVSHRYGKTVALDNVILTVPGGCMAGLIGPDGVGKSTLLGLAAGVRKIQTGTLWALGGDLNDPEHRRRCFARIAYMPQGLGRNLYPTLSIFENLDFVGRLFGQPAAERKARIDDLLHSTGLNPFPDRPTGKLSGGMKQKVSLCSALIHDPDLLILDEPTTGVDPLSRRQFWELIDRIRVRRPHMSVIVSTAYMDEADQFAWLAAMDAGHVIGTGAPAELKARTGAKTLEEAFISLLPSEKRGSHNAIQIPPLVGQTGPPAIEADGLTKRFGTFTAVDHVSFRIAKGEIFGFLGSNGCGKSTTMKMLTGLLPITEGKAFLFGQSVDGQDIETRRNVGYMSQAFSLYSELTVQQNLELHTKLFDLPEAEQGPRVEEMLDRFGLRSAADSNPEDLPLGVRQRLQLAVAVQHRPKMLILDEPTSGVDPVARDQFWEYLIDLSRKDGVTIFLSTHFMNEAERCDRISLMNAGKVLAVGTPRALTEARQAKTLEEAFIGYLVDAAAADKKRPASQEPATALDATHFKAAEKDVPKFSMRRLWACARREAVEIIRDPMRITFAFLGPMILMLVTGYGISFDVEHLRFAVLDQNRSLESREFLESFDGPRFWDRKGDIASGLEMQDRLRSGELKFAIEVPPLYGSDLLRQRRPEIGFWINGDMPFRAETTRTYLSALALNYLVQQSSRHGGPSSAVPTDATAQVSSGLPINLEMRFRYNQGFLSIYSIVPSVIMLMLILVPANMTAVAVVGEMESGSIANFRSTPMTGLEFLAGKQLPYIIIGFISFLTLILMGLVVFRVPVKGSWLALFAGAFIYIIAATGFGLVISTFTRTKVAAVFATSVIALVPTTQFSGLLVPVSSLSGTGRSIGLSFPASWFQQISMGTITKGLGWHELWVNYLVLAAFALAFITAAILILKKQEA